MIWSSWPTFELQAELDEKLLSRLRHIIPTLMGEDFNPTSLDAKATLIRLISAFKSSTAFAKKAYRLHCFDRLSPETLKAYARHIGISPDDYSFPELRDLLATKSWTTRQARETFLAFFELPSHFLENQYVSPPSIEEINPPTPAAPTSVTSAYKPLKDYQLQVKSNALTILAPPRARVMIQMPTGSGKTRTAMELVQDYLQAATSPVTVIWFAHTKELCEQACQCFREVWSHTATSRVQLCRAYERHPFPSIGDDSVFIVTSYQKVVSLMNNDPSQLQNVRARESLIVVDEAHMSIAPRYREAVQSVKGTYAKLVGLTATPGRTVQDEVPELVAQFFDRMVSIAVPDSTPSAIHMLRERGLLARARYEPITVDVEYTLTPSQRKHLETEFEFPQGFLKTLAQDTVRNIEIMKRLLRECDNGRQILFFGCSVEHSRFIAALLLYFKKRAAHLDGSTAADRRGHIIKAFARGELDVLCNYGVLTTGFDAPKVDVVFIARPTQSVILYSQMVGRGLRGPELGGTEDCLIIDVQDHITNFGSAERTQHHFDNYWTDLLE